MCVCVRVWGGRASTQTHIMPPPSPSPPPSPAAISLAVAKGDALPQATDMAKLVRAKPKKVDVRVEVLGQEEATIEVLLL